MDIKPIKTERDYNQVISRIEELLDTQPGTPEFDELEVLSILAEAFETEHHHISAPDPIEALKNVMEWQNLTRKDLEPAIGTRARVSEILNGKRRLTLDMIIRLKFNLGIPADLLIPDTENAKKVAI